VRPVLLVAHLLGIVLWMGGGFAAMALGLAMREMPRQQLAAVAGLVGRLHRTMILPGVLLAVVSGLLLTLQLYGTATATAGFPVPLMIMQVAGLVAAVLALVVNLPTVARLTRLDPAGEHGPLFDSLRQKAARSGMLTGLLAVVALVGGAWLR
jgi:uncharacterized membrane protein